MHFSFQLLTTLCLSLFFYAANAQVNPTDGCGGVPSLTVSTSCNPNNYTLAGNYNNNPLITSTCNSAGLDDGWYSFTAIGTPTNIELTGDRDMVLSVFSACGSGAELACDFALSGNTASVSLSTTTGTTYYIQVHRQSGTNNNSMSGTICLYGPGGSGPANDNPCNATPLTVGTSCTYSNSTNASATGTTGVTAPGCANYQGGDVWYTAIVPASGNLTINTNTGTLTDGGMAIYSGTCSALTLIECDDDDSPNGLMPMITRTGLTPGSTIWIRFWEYANDNNGTFSICAFSPPAGGVGSTCGNANNITSLPYSQTGLTTNGAGDDFSSSSACSDYYMDGDDYVFSYIPTVNQCISITLTNTSTYVGVFLTSGCPSAAGSSCIASNTNSLGNPSISYASLTAGTTYYITVSTWPSPQFTPFDIAVNAITCPVTPGNDNCAGAIAAPVNPDAICNSFVTGTTQLSTQSQSGCVGTADDDVWYSFVAQSSQHDIAFTNLSGTSTDIVHQVFSGTCGSLTSITCEDYSNSTSLVGLAVGNTYYIRVYTYSNGYYANFQLCITSPCGITAAPPSCSLNYSHSNTSYSPESYSTGSLLTFSDDEFADSYTSIGFPFCYDGIVYNDVLVSSNGYVTFPGCYSTHPLSTRSAPGGYSGFSINAAAPNTTNAPNNAILGVWQDIYPSTSTADGAIRTKVVGTAPNRKFVISYYEVRMYSCTADDYNGQIILHETSNNIEILIGEKVVCSTFNGGYGIMGLTNYSGTAAVIPAGYNYPTQWSVPVNSPEGHLFTYNCGTCPNTLPVELVEFSGEPAEEGNRLSWTTASEINNDFFILERSRTGRSFEALATIDGKGNSEMNSYYSWIDNSPKAGISYYRLRQTDVDGKVTYSEIISINRTSDIVPLISVHPNPFREKTMVRIESAGQRNITLFMADQQGRKVFSESRKLSEGLNEIHLNSAGRKGLFFLIIKDENGSVLHSEKLISTE